MTISLAAGSFAQLILFAVVGWIAGDWLLALGARRKSSNDREIVQWPERALMTLVGFVAFAVVAMVLNIVLGGAVFGTHLGVPLLALALFAVRLKNLGAPKDVPWSKVGLFALAVVVLWGLPTILGGTAARSGDTPWHLGWTEQLLAGEPVPEGPAPDQVAANAYPWGFHALLATLVRLVPMTDVSTALVAVQLFLPLALALGAACIVRRVVPEAGWAGAGAAVAFGGFGWLLARETIFFTSPSNARFGADLVVASPNAVYELFPPPSPREIALAILAAAIMLVALGLRSRQRAFLLLGGVVLGLVGLVSVPTLVAGFVCVVGAIALAGRSLRWSSLALIGVPAALVFALWAGPVVSDMVRYGGFVDITPSLGREWPLWTALGSWGLLAPLAVAGAVVVRRQPGAGLLAGLAVGTSLLLGLAIARGELDWSLAGNATTLHQGRFWPVARLLAAAATGVALWAAWRWLRARGRMLASGALALTFAAGLVSPVLATVALSEAVVDHESGYAYRRADVDEGSFMRRVAERLGPDETVVVRGPTPERDTLAFYLFSFSGVRLAAFDDPRLARNDLRIRYAELAARWNERMAGAGFPAEFEIVPVSARDDEAVLSGEFEGIRWALRPVADDSASD